jgi:RNA polymerase sigma-70 factor, ECF subfamily
VAELMASAEDTDLVRRFKRGDGSAFEELLLKYQDRIYNLCRYMLQDAEDARDAAQEVFLKAYKGLRAFKPDSSLYTWLYRIAVNTCLDYKKKARPGQLKDGFFLDDMASTEPSADRLYESKEIGRAIRLALQRLPEHSRVAIVLKEIEDLSYEEIAEVLHTSLGTVKSRISRAREEMRQLLRNKV